jgi:hypothetical protein
MAGDDHLLAVFDEADQLGETIFGFRGADVHACNYSHKLWLYQADCLEFAPPEPVFRGMQLTPADTRLPGNEPPENILAVKVSLMFRETDYFPGTIETQAA